MKLRNPSDANTAYNRAPAFDLETAWNPAPNPDAPSRSLRRRLAENALVLGICFGEVALFQSCNHDSGAPKGAAISRPASSAPGPAQLNK
jgi:hypothetical protein